LKKPHKQPKQLNFSRTLQGQSSLWKSRRYVL